MSLEGEGIHFLWLLRTIGYAKTQQKQTEKAERGGRIRGRKGETKTWSEIRGKESKKKRGRGRRIWGLLELLFIFGDIFFFICKCLCVNMCLCFSMCECLCVRVLRCVCVCVCEWEGVSLGVKCARVSMRQGVCLCVKMWRCVCVCVCVLKGSLALVWRNRSKFLSSLLQHALRLFGRIVLTTTTPKKNHNCFNKWLTFKQK